jgi:uncharacterized protein YutE (UPF0331/DUF86 family)
MVTLLIYQQRKRVISTYFDVDSQVVYEYSKTN